MAVICVGQPLLDGQDQPPKLSTLQQLADGYGWIWAGATWSLAKTEARRQIPGVKGEGSFRYVTVARETVVGRLREPGHQEAAYMVWERDDGVKWAPQGGSLRSPVVGMRRLGWQQLVDYIKAGALPVSPLVDLGDGTGQLRRIAAQGDGPKGVWAGTSSSILQPYPCRCHELSPWGSSQCGRHYCPCWGRADHVELTPPWCCSRRYIVDWSKVVPDVKV